MKNRKWISILLLVSGLAIGFWVIVQPGVVKQIGSWKITKSDLQYRTEISKIYFPDSDEKAALAQLEKSARYLKILEKNGITVTEKDLDEEESRILAQTKDPKQLEKIKLIFKDDKKAYRKNFLKPVLVDRFIYFDFFLNNPKVQNVAHQKAMGLIEASKDKSMSFEDHAKQLGIKVNTLHFDKSGIKLPKSTKAEAQGGVIDQSPKQNEMVYKIIQQEMKKAGPKQMAIWQDKIIPKMTIGETLPQPINRDTQLIVVYLKDKEPNKEATVQVGIIDKLNFDEWLAEQEKQEK